MAKKNKQIRRLQKRFNRNQLKINNMKDLIKDMRRRNIINDKISENLEGMEIPKEIFKKLLSGKRCKYSRELKIFATTIHFYSPKAYDYIRGTFKNSLPHPSRIRKWYSSTNCESGFVEEAFKTLEIKARIMNTENKKCLCTLVIDEMSIMKRLELVGEKVRGYVDFGISCIQHDEDEATEAYVFMAVSINAHWKIPIAYFFIHNLDANERANLVLEAVTRLQNINVEVVCLTCDGPPYNKSMFKKLGSDITLPKPRPYFTTQEKPNQKVFTMLDACHCQKLVRNNLATKQVLYSQRGMIKWNYIENLYNLQEKEDIKLGNKLTKAHMEWQKNKMKVKYATQTLSRSVADAIEFCNVHLKLKEFANSEATVQFIRIIDLAFHLLNCRNTYAKGSKGPMNQFNYVARMEEIENIQNYILQLKNYEGKEIYKFSQDHLELFFCAIRSRSGWNNNPTCKQFISAFKSLLTHAQIRSSGGNVEELDGCSILNISSNTLTVRKNNMNMMVDTSDKDLVNTGCEINEVLKSTEMQNLLDIICDGLSEFQINAVGYISGYVVKMVRKIIKCYECNEALLAETAGTAQKVNNLISQKNRGGLILPSGDVVYICLQTEKALREQMEEINKLDHITEKVALEVLRNINLNNLFCSLEEHIKEQEVDNNHIYKLTKCVIYAYLKIKLSYIVKQNNQKSKPNS